MSNVHVAGTKLQVAGDNLKVSDRHACRKAKRSCKDVDRSCSRHETSCRRRQLEGKRVAGCSMLVENENDHVKAPPVQVAGSKFHVGRDNLKVNGWQDAASR